ncbi:sigma 54-interacting transcriptional regulator [Sedimentibacter hydroxybenzoicus DSM 7310]|uniref:Sigma 54-interacting transcriptional regulator n=1 Tax=Sedimentibacter hydroxybenzoicus DSM 7310 TaxID=1123245 RepID=A0A974BJC5_SEDHY|nr:sigma 54-interacting transcriptional regulator [Sedimentibacter hydroxybenzoicus]NYB73951.1 sigma 54-interacting transcriptional regulator [Sedimentibacter hydroxybenzoicus DSM 7310]
MIPKYIITSPNKQFTQMVYNTTKELGFTDFILIENALEEAVDIVAKYIKEFPISIIVSRGATAKMIRKITDIPVLEADSTPFDIITSIMEAMKTSKNIAFIHYDKSITENFSNIIDVFNINLKEYYYNNHSEIEQCVYDAYKDKNEVVVCGYSYIENICKKLGIASVMYSTSNYAMKEILSKASLIKYAQERQIMHERQLITFINEMPDGVIYLNERNVITLINNTGKKLLLLNDNQDIAGQPISNFISKHNLLEIINKKKNELGKEINFSGNKILLRSTPLFAKESYMGTVLIFQKSSFISRLDQNVRRQNISKGMHAYMTFKDLEATTVSAEMKNCINKAKQYANTESTILITGESGTGKELFAQSIHNSSSRKNQPFVAINCASLSQNLLESELFGYEEGSFTGAKAGGKPGLFELAHNGTLFLDELGLLPLSVQVQLLRVLQERQVMRVGGTKMIPISIRVIAATNSNLKNAVENGTFRHDLYYRLNVLNISIPPLNSRKDDIPLLIEHYLSLFSARYNKNIKSCSPDFIQAFRNHNWSGNIRELVNYLMRIVILSDSETLTTDDIVKSEINLISNESLTPEKQTGNLDDFIVLNPDTLESMEKSIIKWYMDKYDGNRSAICKLLNISRTTLWKKLSDIKQEN